VQGTSHRIAATLYRTSKGGYALRETSEEGAGNGIASIEFLDTIPQNGWAQLNVTTNAGYTDAEQAYAAGYAEASVTYQHISDFYYNFVVGNYNWTTQSDFPVGLQSYFTTNQAYMRGQVAANPKDPYWQQVGTMVAQFDGLMDGYGNATKAHTGLTPLTEMQMLALVAGGDLFELSAKYGPQDQMRPTRAPSPADRYKNGHCSALFSMKDDMSEIYFGHTAWFNYFCMIRIMKRYNFNFNSSVVKSLHFSSYPGVLTSFDDFYVGSTGLVSIETSIGVYNNSLYDYINPTGQLQYWVRIMVANRMATNASTWCTIFAAYNSGTYNNQWMVLDTAQFTPGPNGTNPLPAGSFYVMDQFPGPYIQWSDLTNVLNFGHWPSYNVPYHYELWLVGGYLANDWSYWAAPRGNIFRRDAGKVENMTSFQSIMRYNNWEHDPLSSGPWDAISARGDLGPAPAWCGGGYDSKVSSVSLVRSGMGIIAQSGPTYQQQPVFSFSTTKAPCFEGKGLPNTWDFPWVQF
jgi:hypothetical protein